jgi:hypothetical protein
MTPPTSVNVVWYHAACARREVQNRTAVSGKHQLSPFTLITSDLAALPPVQWLVVLPACRRFTHERRA